MVLGCSKQCYRRTLGKVVVVIITGIIIIITITIIIIIIIYIGLFLNFSLHTRIYEIQCLKHCKSRRQAILG